MRNWIIFILFEVFLFGGSISAQQPPAACKLPIKYGNKNQVDPKSLSVRSISGLAVIEAGHPTKELAPIPACLGLFSEGDRRMVATVIADETGQFKFEFVPKGRYRLIVRDPQDAFCVANVPLRVVAWPRGTIKPLVIHMRPTGIDDCSYASVK